MSEAAVNPSDQVTKTNQRLFRRYAGVFDKPTSPQDFVSHAHKLAHWLRDFKAYYDAARPEIVRLLLIAHKTVRNALDIDPGVPLFTSHYPQVPMVQAYCKLVETVEPYKEYFNREPASYGHIRALLATIHGPSLTSNVISSQPQSSPKQQDDTDRNQLSAGMPVQASATIDPDVTVIEKPPNFPDNNKESQQVMSTATPNENPTASTSRPKVKKRKTIDFNLLVKQDIKGLVEKKGSQTPASLIDTNKVNTSSISTPLPPPTPRSPSVVRVGTSVEQADHKPITTTSQKLSSQEEEHFQLSLKPDSEIRTLPEAIPKPEEIPGPITAPNIEHPMDVDEYPVPGDSKPQNAPMADAGNKPTKLDHSENPNKPNTTFRPESASTSHLLSHGSGVSPDNPSPITKPSENTPMAMEVDTLESSLPQNLARVSSSSPHVSLPPSNPSNPSETISMDVDVPEPNPVDQNSGPSTADSVPTSKPLEAAPIGSPLKKDAPEPSLSPNVTLPEPQSRQSDKLSENQTGDTKSTTPSLPPKATPEVPSRHSESPISKTKFPIRIIARQEGLKTHGRISIRFNILEPTYTMISNWVKITTDPTDTIPLKSCFCFYLGCYLTAELEESAKTHDCTTFEEQVAATRPNWPPPSSATMNVLFKDVREDLPLSPPFQVTPNKLVDVCPFIVCGENTIEVAQRQDLSQYTFVLHAYWPSKEQLTQVKQKRQKEKEWRTWLCDITKPLKIPPITYGLRIS